MFRSGVGLRSKRCCHFDDGCAMVDAFAAPPEKKAAAAAAPPAPRPRRGPRHRTVPAPAPVALSAPPVLQRVAGLRQWRAPLRPSPVRPRHTWRPGSPRRHVRRRKSPLPPRVRPPPSNAPHRRRGPQAVSSGVSRMCNRRSPAPSRASSAASPSHFATNRAKPAAAAVAIEEPVEPLRTARAAHAPAQPSGRTRGTRNRTLRRRRIAQTAQEQSPAAIAVESAG